MTPLLVINRAFITALAINENAYHLSPTTASISSLLVSCPLDRPQRGVVFMRQGDGSEIQLNLMTLVRLNQGCTSRSNLTDVTPAFVADDYESLFDPRSRSVKFISSFFFFYLPNSLENNHNKS